MESRFHEIYKARTTRYGSGLDRISLSRRLSAANKQRQSFRNTLMMERRNIPNGVISPIVTPVAHRHADNKKKEKVVPINDERKEKLLKWQEEKKKRLEAEAKTKKPLFKVSHVTYSDDLNKVYNQIKGKPIPKKTKEQTSIAPSASYKFKPPANIRPMELKRIVDAGNKKVQQVKREVPTSSRVTRSQKQPLPALTKEPEMACNCKECPSTSGLSKMSQRGKIFSTSSESDSDSQQKRPSKTKTVRRQTTSKTHQRPDLTKRQLKDNKKTNTYAPESCDNNEDDSIKGSNAQDDGKPSSSSLSTDYSVGEVENTTDSGPSSSQPVTPLNKNVRCVTYVSPFVTLSRGKENARKEYQRRSEHGGSDKEASTSPKAAAVYFHRLLNNQIDRLRGMCQVWNIYKERENPAEEVCDMINVAIGQTELLINKKFRQFQELIDMCETGNSEKPVQCLDLHGFWDMITIQVNNLDKRFENLQRLKDNDWEEILPEVEVKQKIKPTRKGTKKASVKSGSSVRAFIQERRRKAAGDQNIEEICIVSDHQSTESKSKTPQSKTHNLRVSALMSSGNSRLSSPGLTMMKVTRSAKSIGNITVGTPANSQSVNTPKSILKSQRRSQRRSRSQARKSKAVLFKEDDSPKMNENQENDCNMSNIAPVSPPSDKQPLRRSSRRLATRK